jgi:DNA-binding protein HU-beta
VNHQELAEAVAEKAGINKAEAIRAVGAMLNAIKEELTRGEKIAISGFGTFEAVRRQAREGRNPQTGGKVQIAASTAVKFKPGKGLKEALNAGGT